MRRHRFLLDAEVYRLPQAAPPAPSAAAFCLCPAGAWSGMNPALCQAQQMLYQLAFAQAQAVARPSLPERDLLAVWN